MTGAVVFTLVIFVAVIGTIVLAVNLLYEPQYYTCYGGRTLVFIDGQALCFESAIPATEVPSP